MKKNAKPTKPKESKEIEDKKDEKDEKEEEEEDDEDESRRVFSGVFSDDESDSEESRLVLSHRIFGDFSPILGTLHLLIILFFTNFELNYCKSLEPVNINPCV